MTERCNHTSVGMLVSRDDRLLLIERRRPPYGWAPPAGHVDDGESYALAAERELREEVGLRAELLIAVHEGRHENRCRRPGGDFHDWRVYEVAATGEPVRSQDETTGMRWADDDQLRRLASRTRAYLAGEIAENDWRQAPGLEPVWLTMLCELGWIDLHREGPGSACPRVVALCGSTRFAAELAQAAREEAVAGRIVLRPDCDLKTPDPLWPPKRIEKVKRDLDNLHRAKIRLADEVLVVAPGGYVGESTRAEIAYAAELGRPVRYWPDGDRRGAAVTEGQAVRGSKATGEGAPF